MKKIRRVYVAGAYNGPNVMVVLENMRKGMRLSTEVMLAGFSPFCPWIDFHFELMLRDGEKFTIEDYYSYSIDWLRVSDAMLLVPGWENSNGTRKELAVAEKLGIPIFRTLKHLTDYAWDANESD